MKPRHAREDAPRIDVDEPQDLIEYTANQGMPARLAEPGPGDANTPSPALVTPQPVKTPQNRAQSLRSQDA